jgi:hypothetical protein
MRSRNGSSNGAVFGGGRGVEVSEEASENEGELRDVGEPEYITVDVTAIPRRKVGRPRKSSPRPIRPITDFVPSYVRTPGPSIPNPFLRTTSDSVSSSRRNSRETLGPQQGQPSLKRGNSSRGGSASAVVRRDTECSFCEGGEESNKSGVPEELVSCAECGRSSESRFVQIGKDTRSSKRERFPDRRLRASNVQITPLSVAHPSCNDMSDEGLVETVKLYNWKCMECKKCEVCRKKGQQVSIS